MRAILIDDELGAIKNLRLLLDGFSSAIDVVGYATNTNEAELKIKLLKPDVIFLDIEMPNESGINFLRRLNYYDFEVVFVTAYNEFAVQAFKLNAIDYILKPIDLEELKHCIARLDLVFKLKESYREKLTQEKIEYFFSSETGASNSKIALKCKDKIELVQFKDILFLKGEGTYSEFVYLNKGIRNQTLMSYPLSHYESILPKIDFLRVHKSYILNKNHLAEIDKEQGYYLITDYGDKIPLSKRRVSEIITQLKK